MKSTLVAGLGQSLTYTIPVEKTVPHVYRESELFRAMPPVFATAYLVGLIEWACMELLQPHLEPGEQSLGTAIAVTHTAATPVNLSVNVEVLVERVDARRIAFRVKAHDDLDVIGEGTHERFVIDRERFLKRVAEKAQKAQQAVKR
ncbi:MAG TPA: thioesterase family protein [Polyangiaceae bacterium]|nr:thioesterase family protein [Polyangiaceae bacterium]